jgi:predicted DNA-binding protein YlxM (UPF0122 family)
MAKRLTGQSQNHEHWARLLSLYGPLLTERQRTLLEQHVLQGRSFADLGREYRVSRQAVHDAVRKAQAVLQSYEARLGSLAAKVSQEPAGLNIVRARLDDLRKRVAGSGIIYRSDWIVRELTKILEMLVDPAPEAANR